MADTIRSRFGGVRNKKDVPLFCFLELTKRCDNNCVHCYGNIAEFDAQEQSAEMSTAEVLSIAGQLREMDVLEIVLTGGEPLVRDDFAVIYTALRKMGFLVTVFTNATRIDHRIISLWRKYKPWLVEVSLYGATAPTWDAVTRSPGAFERTHTGLQLLQAAGIPVRLKAMAMQANYHELADIQSYGRRNTRDYFRIDPFLSFRLDGNRQRNDLIRSQRLSVDAIVRLERDDPEKWSGLQQKCGAVGTDYVHAAACRQLLFCGAGKTGIYIDSHCRFKLCLALHGPDYMFDLRQGTLRQAYTEFCRKVFAGTTRNPEFLKKCHSCALVNLCWYCPGHSLLETGRADEWSEYFCLLTKRRAVALGLLDEKCWPYEYGAECAAGDAGEPCSAEQPRRCTADGK